MKNCGRQLLFVCLILLAGNLPLLPLSAAEVDQQLLQSLTSDAGHDQARRRQFKPDRDAKKIYDNEREKELALFLEQQEKWELVRERGLTEYRNRKQDKAPADDGPEFKADLQEKIKDQKKMEVARRTVVQTRQKVNLQASPTAVGDELEELNLNQKRPRFDTRKRRKNKWVKGSSGGSASGSGSSGGGGFAPPPAAFDDFPNQPDFMPAPAMDGFEEIPPPPPPVNFDGSQGFGGGIDSGFGDLPPPPPPLLDDDF